MYVATGVKLSPHLVNTVFKIFDVDRDDQLSYKEFIGIMKDRLNRGFRVRILVFIVVLADFLLLTNTYLSTCSTSRLQTNSPYV